VRTLRIVSVLLCAVALSGQGSKGKFEPLLDSFTFRNLGPFRAGAWVADLAVPEGSPRGRTFYVGARSGGVWKTNNRGTTFQPVTDEAGLMSIGALAVAPSNPEIVWLGEGDASATRSAYHGKGVFRSTDGAKTWQHVGLAETQHISRIVIHPSNPNVVWVAALGKLYSTGPDRGVFKTTDGGKSWAKTLFVSEGAGAVDLVIDRRNPNVLYAATYEVRRTAWRIYDGGPASGIFKSTDGGTTWRRLEGGLPGGTIGRIGLDIHRKNPDVLYAVLDNFNPKPGSTQQGRDSVIGGEVYRTSDGGATWRKMNKATDDVSRKTGYAFNQIRVDPNHPDRIFITGSNLIASEDGGQTWQGLGFAGPPPPGGLTPAAIAAAQQRPLRRAFGDFRAFWINPEDSEHMLAASDGGVFVSYDGGRTCEHLMNLPLGEVYALGADMEYPYRIFEGLQDHESWMAPVNGPSGSVGIEDWKTVGIGDGMYNQPDPNGRFTYNTQEFGTPVRIDLVERTRTVITPVRTGGSARLRVNWTAPIRLSPHDSKVLYFGAETLFRSKDRGDHWEEISPDLTTNNPEKISGPGAGIQHCTITTIAESPAKAGVIWVGTDDGKIQVTQNGGAHWTDATQAMAAVGGPADAWVTRVFPSPFDAATAYVTKSRRRQDDFRVFVFRTTDSGKSWKNISSGLPEGGANVIAEDPRKAGLLFLGTDSGTFVSFDAGVTWERFKANVPPAPVHDLMIHPREGDLIVGTFGRGVWVTNITPLREFSDALLAGGAHLFAVRPFAERREIAWGNYRLYGDRYLTTPNEPNGMRIVYLTKSTAKVEIAVSDASGKLIRKVPIPAAKAGMNQVTWLLDDDGGNPVPAGDYVVSLGLGGETLTQPAKLLSRAPEDLPRRRRVRPQ